jgi:hypothetical protein
VVSKAAPTLTTMASAATTLGSSVSDTASLSGGDEPGGTITFDLYGPADATCSGTPAATATVPVSGNGSYSSGPLTPSVAGRYRFRASYSGDDNNPAVRAGPCLTRSEMVVVGPAVAATIPES